MAFTAKRLAQFQAAAAETSHYTVPADTLAVVKNIVIANTSTVDVSLSLSIVPAGGVAGLENRIVPGLVIPPLSVVPLDVTQVMAAGDYISASASLANALTVTISGMEDPGSNGLSAGTVIGDPPVWGSPVPTGDANADGVATSLPRADHVHKGILAVDQYGPAPGALTGQASAAGVATTPSRSDHAHQITPLIDSGWVAPTFQNGWLNYDAAVYPAAAYRRIGTWVYLRGLLKSGTVGAVPAFTLPVGFRAQRIHHLVTLANGLIATVRIQPTGAIELQTGSNLWFSIDSLYFETT